MLFVFYREWMAWLLLLAVAFLPLLSLLLSLPAICMAKISLHCPTEVSVGQLVRLQVRCICKLPAPPVSGKFKVKHSITGETAVVRQGKEVDTSHCGALQINPNRIWVCDYLGLWRFPCRKQNSIVLTVLPEPVQPRNLPKPSQDGTTGWRPKRGYAENYELRQYNPGDDLRNIHWKLSSKTGKLILREPVESVKKQLTVTLMLEDNESRLDDLLGQLLWVSRYLLEAGVTHEVRCLTGRGMEVWRVHNPESQQQMLRHILASPACRENMVVPEIPGSYRIGGGSHEA